MFSRKSSMDRFSKIIPTTMFSWKSSMVFDIYNIICKYKTLEQFLYSLRKLEMFLQVIQLRKACSHPYIFPGIEPEPYKEGEHLVQASGKLIILDLLLQKLYDSGHPVLLYAKMTSTLEILQDFLKARKYSYERLDGSVQAEEHFAAIRNFSGPSADGTMVSKADGNNAFVFMISTRAGGVGLNLVAADTVIFYEQDWNPQVDKQALQRAHRIGQMSHVLSINLVTGHTVKEVIMGRGKRKLQLGHNVMGDYAVDRDGKEATGVDMGDLRSIIFGLHTFDLKEVDNGELNSIKLSDLNAMADKVIPIRREQILGKASWKSEVDPNLLDRSDLVQGNYASTCFDFSLDGSSYFSWVETFKETSLPSGDSILEMRNRKKLPEDKHLKLEAARKVGE